MFHSIYTDVLLNIGGVDPITKDRLLHQLGVLSLAELFTIRQKRRSMIDGLERLWINFQSKSQSAAPLPSPMALTSRDLVTAIPWKPAGMNTLVPTMLGAGPLKFSAKADDLGGAHFFYAFGMGKGAGNLAVEEAASRASRPVIRMEYGFISSFDLALNDSIQHSIILCPGTMYYDARNESSMERDLNSEDFAISSEDASRADSLIKTIIERKLTKYNHAPDIPLADLIEVSARKKILLVDQRFGDASISMGLANQDSFQRMWEYALEHTEHDILVKLHPDAVGGGKESCLSKILPKELPKNVYLLKSDINPFNVLSEVDKVFVCVSQLGFEALMLGKEVHCFGVSFYTGWGLTTDHVKPLRPRRKRSLQELFYIFYIEYSRYAIDVGRPCELEQLLDHLHQNKPPAVSVIQGHRKISAKTSGLKILFIIPSGRFGATGRYFQVLALELKKLGAEVLVLAEAYENKVYEGIEWLKIEFDGVRLAKTLRKRIVDFAPDVIYENGVRTRAQRAALEALYLTNAKLALQSEDDDVQVYLARHPKANKDLIQVLDKPRLSHHEILKFIKLNDWVHTAKVLMNPDYDRWVDPLLRALCYHCSSLNTAIWHPFARRLTDEFGAPTMVVPPVADMRELTEQRLAPIRQERLGPVKEGNVVLFLGGTIYDYSPEFELFLRSLNILCEREGRYDVSLVVVSGRSKLNVSELARQTLDVRIQFIDLGAPDDNEYMRYLVLSDVICSPGLPDRFNLYWLPSRLVKAMLIGKAILSTKIGFGESLEHGVNAILIDGEDPAEWAKSMSMIFDRNAIRRIGQEGMAFAKINFDARKVAGELLDKFYDLTQQRSSSLSAPQVASR